ncbi:MAG TPA: L-aspartate oxidase [Acidobacteriota bacterium]|nr:L-aspartate oxidase [Acidobacteriota bacterium]
MTKSGWDEETGTDVVIAGAGIAGMATALALKPARCLLLTKGRLGRSGATPLAQGGIAAALDPKDSPALHAEDTIRASAGLADSRLVQQVVSCGRAGVERLLDWGTPFDRERDGKLSLGREAAHSRRRIIHAGGDSTGKAIACSLSDAVRSSPHIQVLEDFHCTRLLSEADSVVGAFGFSKEGRRIGITASRIVLATGGAGQLFWKTTNPPESTGDGIVLAARAGAVLADLEFFQFHPTALDVQGDPLPLLTEALRGEGATLLDGRGRRFMPDEHPAAELAPRDIVARAIWNRQQQGEPVYLDARVAIGEDFPKRFSTVFESCLQRGYDPRRQLLPVTPAAHYSIGGVATDSCGRTSLRGLWACGEVAATGLHGANRLASNSLLESIVFALAVSQDLGESAPMRDPKLYRRLGPDSETAPGLSPAPWRSALRKTMWRSVGLIRNRRDLELAAEAARQWKADRSDVGVEDRNLLSLAEMVIAAALRREESRGAHFRSDFPSSGSSWNRRLFWRNGIPIDDPPLPQTVSGTASAVATCNE